MTKPILLLLPVFMFHCHRVEESSVTKAFKDVRKAVKRDDGLYNVICFDGSIETGVSLAQIESDRVCEGPTTTPSVEFIVECESSRGLLNKTYAALKKIAGQSTCRDAYRVLRERDSLIFFAYPPASPDAIETLSPLRHLTNLKHLGVFAQRINDLTPLQNLTELRSLVLNYNPVSDVTSLKDLRKLEILDLSHNQIFDFNPVERLPALKTLKKEGNPGALAFSK